MERVQALLGALCLRTPGTRLDLPTTLPSEARRTLHHEAEKLGLSHASHGHGPRRFVSVAVPTKCERSRLLALYEESQKGGHTGKHKGGKGPRAGAQRWSKEEWEKKRSAGHRVGTSGTNNETQSNADNLCLSRLPAEQDQLIQIITKKKKKKKKKKQPQGNGDGTDMGSEAQPTQDGAEEEAATVWSKRPKGGFSLLAGESGSDDGEDDTSVVNDAAPKKQKRKRKKKAKVKQEPVVEDEDLDDLLAEFRVGKCFTKGCKKRVATISMICKHCNERFCVEHRNPIFHGCRAAAQKVARANMLTAHRKVRKDKSPAEQAALQKKIQQQADARKRKQKKKK